MPRSWAGLSALSDSAPPSRERLFFFFFMQILAVVVLYKQLPEQSETIRSLIQVFERNPEFKSALRVLLWDNSPVPATRVSLPFP